MRLRRPVEWQEARCASIPKSRGREVGVQRPIVPSPPAQVVVSRALLAEHRDALAPRWLAAEGFAKGGCAEDHLLTMRVIWENML